MTPNQAFESFHGIDDYLPQSKIIFKDCRTVQKEVYTTYTGSDMYRTIKIYQGNDGLFYMVVTDFDNMLASRPDQVEVLVFRFEPPVLRQPFMLLTPLYHKASRRYLLV